MDKDSLLPSQHFSEWKPSILSKLFWNSKFIIRPFHRIRLLYCKFHSEHVQGPQTTNFIVIFIEYLVDSVMQQYHNRKYMFITLYRVMTYALFYVMQCAYACMPWMFFFTVHEHADLWKGSVLLNRHWLTALSLPTFPPFVFLPFLPVWTST